MSFPNSVPPLCPVTSTLNCQTKKSKLFQPIKQNYAKKGPISIRACLSRPSACWSFTSQGTQAYQQDYSTKVTSCSLVQFPCTWRTCNYIMDWGSFWHNSRVIFKHLNYCFCSQLHEGALKGLLLSHWYFSCSRWLEGLAQGWSALSDREMFGTSKAHGFCSRVISVKMLQRMLFWAFTHHIILRVSRFAHF